MMRFCDFFIDYKISLKDIKGIIPTAQLPLYRRISIVALFVIAVIGLVAMVLNNPKLAMIAFSLLLVLIIAFIIIDSTKRNLSKMLCDHYAPYSKQRMETVINLLKKYNIKTDDIQTIDLLIEEAKKAQIQSDYLLPIIKPLKALGAIIFPIIAYVAKKMGDAATVEEIIPLVLQIIVFICVFAIIIATVPFLKDFIYRDYNKYNELIDDLSQIKLFYSKKK